VIVIVSQPDFNNSSEIFQHQLRQTGGPLIYDLIPPV